MTKSAKQRFAVASQLARGLSVRTKKFVELLASDPTHNQTAAARGAGYKDPKVRGSKLMAIPKVRSYYEALLNAASELAKTNGVIPPAPAPAPDVAAAMVVSGSYTPSAQLLGTAMDAAETIQRLSDHARVNVLDFISYEPVLHKDGTPMNTPQGQPVYRPFVDVKKIEALGKGHLVKKIKEGQYGTELELVDSQGALKTLAQIHGLAGDDGARGADEGVRRRSWREFLASLPPQVILGMHRRMLSSGSHVIDANVVGAHAG